MSTLKLPSRLCLSWRTCTADTSKGHKDTWLPSCVHALNSKYTSGLEELQHWLSQTLVYTGHTEVRWSEARAPQCSNKVWEAVCSLKPILSWFVTLIPKSRGKEKTQRVSLHLSPIYERQGFSFLSMGVIERYRGDTPLLIRLSNPPLSLQLLFQN